MICGLAHMQRVRQCEQCRSSERGAWISMTRTPASLLERLRTSPDDQAWDRFVDLYAPLVYRWQEEHDSMVLGRALNLIQHEFAEPTWRAFMKTAVDGLTPRQAARELGITANAARIAKCRVLRRLRQEIEGLLE